MIRVLHVIDSLDLGGAQTALLNLVKFADRGRFQHEVAAMHGEGFFAEAFREIRVPVHSLSAKKWPPGYLWRLPGLLRRGRFDVVQCHLFGANWIGKPLAALAGTRVIYHHDQCNDAFRSGSRVATFVDALVNRLSTRVLAVSRSVERFAVDVEGVPAERVTVLPNSVDLSVFSPGDAAERAEVRRRFGLPESGLVVGGVGRLVFQKNFDLLIGAVGPLLADRGNVTVAIFGAGPDEGALRGLGGAFGERVRFLGQVADRRAVYAALDLLVLPSRFEGLPMTALEAMASGVPVVATAVDGMRELVADEPGAAWLVPVGDAVALREVVGELLDDAAARAEQAAAARRVVERRFDARRLAAELEALYESDLAR
jgi:glycosyltransferase involved in cell wall biosynthesis